MNIRYWSILVTFIAMLFGAVPFVFVFQALGISEANMLIGYSTVASYVIGTLIIFLLLLPEFHAMCGIVTRLKRLQSTKDLVCATVDAKH